MRVRKAFLFTRLVLAIVSFAIKVDGDVKHLLKVWTSF